MGGFFGGLLALLGLAGLGYGIYKGAEKLSSSAADSTGGVNALAQRIEKEGLLPSLFPKATGSSSAGSGSSSGGYTDPAAWGTAIKSVTEAGLSIAKQVNASGASPLKPSGSKGGLFDVSWADVAVD